MSQLDFNGQARKNQKTGWFTVLAAELLSAATRVSDVFNDYYALGLMLEVVTANKTGVPTFTPKLLVPSAVSGNLTVVTFTAISANGTSVLILYPVTLTDMGTEKKIATLPRDWRLELTYTGTPSTDKIDTRVSGRYI